jgi:hypothetical protein
MRRYTRGWDTRRYVHGRDRPGVRTRRDAQRCTYTGTGRTEVRTRTGCAGNWGRRGNALHSMVRSGQEPFGPGTVAVSDDVVIPRGLDGAEGRRLPVHALDLVETGMPQGQDGNPEKSSSACAKEGRYAFLPSGDAGAVRRGHGGAGSPGGDPPGGPGRPLGSGAFVRPPTGAAARVRRPTAPFRPAFAEGGVVRAVRPHGSLTTPRRPLATNRSSKGDQAATVRQHQVGVSPVMRDG